MQMNLHHLHCQTLIDNADAWFFMCSCFIVLSYLLAFVYKRPHIRQHHVPFIQVFSIQHRGAFWCMTLYLRCIHYITNTFTEKYSKSTLSISITEFQWISHHALPWYGKHTYKSITILHFCTYLHELNWHEIHTHKKNSQCKHDKIPRKVQVHKGPQNKMPNFKTSFKSVKKESFSSILH